MAVIRHGLRIASPLVEDGVVEQSDRRKPPLLFCPGLDGSRLSAFLQLPKLGEDFDVYVLEASADDRTEFDDVVAFCRNFASGLGRPYYMLGESAGALVALRVHQDVRARGVILVNPATSYRRSNLRAAAIAGKPLGGLFFASDAAGLGWQLLRIFAGFELPAVIDSAEREAYMGRIALSLPRRRLPDAATIQWRLEHWLEAGANATRVRDDDRLVVVAGGRDEALPSVDEARTTFANCSKTFVVQGASHGTTLAVRCDLASIARWAFFDGPEPTGGLVRRRHPRVDPRDYETFRAPRRAEVCVGPDCVKDGATDVKRLLSAKVVCDVRSTECQGLCGDGPVVKLVGGATKTDVTTLAKVDELARQLGTLDPPAIPGQAVRSRRRGPLDLDRTKRTLIQRAAWFGIILAVAAVQEHRELQLVPDRLIIFAAFLASTAIVPEAGPSVIFRKLKGTLNQRS